MRVGNTGRPPYLHPVGQIWPLQGHHIAIAADEPLLGSLGHEFAIIVWLDLPKRKNRQSQNILAVSAPAAKAPAPTMHPIVTASQGLMVDAIMRSSSS